MSSTTDRRLRRLEGQRRGVEIRLLIRQSYPGQPIVEAWRDMHGDLTIPTDRQFALMPPEPATAEEWEALYRPEARH